MKSGFTRGLFVGAVVGSVASILADPNSREKAKGLINQGGRVFRRAERGVETVTDNMDDAMSGLYEGDTGDEGYTTVYGTGDPVQQKMAVLEKRLEELEQRGV